MTKGLVNVIEEMVSKRKVPFDYIKWLGKSFMEKLLPLHTILPYHSSPRKKSRKRNKFATYSSWQ